MNYAEKGIVDTPWSILHFGGGIALGFIAKNAVYTLPVIIGWELFEQAVLAEENEWWKEPATNSIMDIVIGFSGAFVGSMMRQGI
jgi:hypothetical protein